MGRERGFETSVEGVIHDGRRRGQVPDGDGGLPSAYLLLMVALLLSVVVSVIILDC